MVSTGIVSLGKRAAGRTALTRTFKLNDKMFLTTKILIEWRLQPNN